MSVSAVNVSHILQPCRRDAAERIKKTKLRKDGTRYLSYRSIGKCRPKTKHIA